MKIFLFSILFYQLLFAENNREIFECLATNINGQDIELRASVAQGGVFHPSILVDKLNVFFVLDVGTNNETSTQFKYKGSSNVDDYIIETYLSSNNQEDIKIDVPTKNDKLLQNNGGMYFFILTKRNNTITYTCKQKN
jgi:hypothetical protein